MIGWSRVTWPSIDRSFHDSWVAAKCVFSPVTYLLFNSCATKFCKNGRQEEPHKVNLSPLCFEWRLWRGRSCTESSVNGWGCFTQVFMAAGCRFNTGHTASVNWRLPVPLWPTSELKKHFPECFRLFQTGSFRKHHFKTVPVFLFLSEGQSGNPSPSPTMATGTVACARSGTALRRSSVWCVMSEKGRPLGKNDSSCLMFWPSEHCSRSIWITPRMCVTRKSPRVELRGWLCCKLCD